MDVDHFSQYFNKAPVLYVLGRQHRVDVRFHCYDMLHYTSPTNLCWCQKTRMTALLCGIKISAVRSFVLSQSMCDRWKYRQNYDFQDRVIYLKLYS